MTSMKKWQNSPTPSIISFITSIVPPIIILLSTINTPWYIVAYSPIAIPVGIVSVIFGLIGLKTKLNRLAIIALIINLATLIFFITPK